jgi:hypothetical protein
MNFAQQPPPPPTICKRFQTQERRFFGFDSQVSTYLGAVGRPQGDLVEGQLGTHPALFSRMLVIVAL